MRDYPVSRPWLTICMLVFVALTISTGAARLGFDSSYSAFFDPDDRQRVAYQSVRDTFDASDSLLFLLEGSDPLFTVAGVEALQDLVGRAEGVPYSLRVEALTNWQHVQNLGGEVHVMDLLPAGKVDADSVAVARAVVLDRPELIGRLVSADGRIAAVNVTVRPRGDPLAAAAMMVEEARAIAAGFEVDYPGSRVHVSGIVAMNHAFAEATVLDWSTLIPLLLVTLLVLLAWFLGSWRASVATGVIMALSVSVAMGVGGWFGIKLDSATAISPLIIATLATAGAVHVLRVCLSVPHEPGGRGKAWRTALNTIRQPIWVSAITTALGMLSFNVSDVPPFRNLGNLVATGVITAAVLNLYLLPALMCVFNERHRPRRSRLTMNVANMVSWLRPRSQLVLVIGGLGLAVATAGTVRLVANDDFVDYFSERLAFRQAAEFQDAHFGGLYDIELELESLTDTGIHDPRYLSELQAFGVWLRAQPEVRHVSLWSDPMMRAAVAMHRSNLALESAEGVTGSAAIADDLLPTSAEEAAQLGLLLELSLPQGHSLSNVMRADEGATRGFVVYGNLSGTQMLEQEARVLAWLAENASTIKVRHGSINLMFSHLGPRNWNQMMFGTAIAITIISALVAMQLRSVSIGLVALLINAVPIAAAFGLWGWMVGDVSLSLSTAAAMTFGVVVDDSIHLLFWYRRSRRDGGDRVDAVQVALERAGGAVLITTVVICAGFAVLSFSAFSLDAHLARITVLIVAVAGVVDLVLLPALLLARGKGEARDWKDRLPG